MATIFEALPTPSLFIILLPTSVILLSLLTSFIIYLHKVWWNPIRIKNALASQGINGPPYKLIHGNNKEVFEMSMAARKRPLELSDHNAFKKVQPHVHSWLKIYGKNILTWYGTIPQLNITEPNLIKEVLNNKGNLYPKPKAEDFLFRLLGDGVVNAEGEKWARQRKLANHAFHGEGLKGMIPAMIEAADRMLEKWKKHEGKEIEVFEEYRLLTSEIISMSAFGSSYEEGQVIFDMLMKFGGMIHKHGVKSTKLPIIGNFLSKRDDIEGAKVENEIRRKIVEIIKDREEKMKKGEVDENRTDYLALLLKAHQDPDESKRLTVQDIIDDSKTFYFAGQDTTTTSLSWTSLLLATHPEWQEKARKEVFEVFGNQTPNPNDTASIAKLKTLTMIVNETLRLYPPVLVVTRQTVKEVRLGENLIIPANVEIKISPTAVHHDTDLWGEDAHLFKPERFEEGVMKATNNNPTAYIPFGSGPRTCVGFNFANTEVKLVISMILQRYHMTVSPTYVHSPAIHLSTRPQHGLQLIFHAL